MIVSRRGAVLLEMVLALALFVAGAAMLTQLQTSVARSLERSQRSVEATDLARKALAELELGIITLADLQTMRVRTEQSLDRMERRDQMDDLAEPSPWQLSVHTERSPYPGLTLVEVTVAYVGEAPPSAVSLERNFDEHADRNEVRITLRQLLRLRGDAEQDARGVSTDVEGGL